MNRCGAIAALSVFPLSVFAWTSFHPNEIDSSTDNSGYIVCTPNSMGGADCIRSNEYRSDGRIPDADRPCYSTGSGTIICNPNQPGSRNNGTQMQPNAIGSYVVKTPNNRCHQNGIGATICN
jgi:hypothetical protein